MSLVMASVAEAAPRYPIRVVQVSKAERARHKAAFESREPVHWTQLVMNSRGFITYLATDDPAFQAPDGVDAVRVRDLLRREAASFGIDPADLDRELDSLGACGTRLFHNPDVPALGQVSISCEPTDDHIVLAIRVTPWLDIEPRLSSDDALGRVLGGRYAFTSMEWARPLLDCGMGGTCFKPHWVTHHGVSEMTVNDLGEMDARVYRDGNVLRLVYCIDANWNDRERNVIVRPLGKAKPLPYVVDAVTGAALPLHPKRCAYLPWID